jgi:hypothetical protein
MPPPITCAIGITVESKIEQWTYRIRLIDTICRNFATARAVFHHVCTAHVKHLPDFVCLWNGCDRIRRQKWALISHVQVGEMIIEQTS